MRKLLVLPLLVVFLSACSGTQFVYRNADWFISWEVDDYVSFNAEQQAQFDKTLADWLAWHCQSELPRYRTLLQDLSAMLAETPDQPVDSAALEVMSERLAQFWTVLVTRASRDAAPILKSLDDRQVQQILAEVDKRNREFYDEYVAIDAAELEDIRVARVKKSTKRWTGTISKEQLALAEDWAQQADNVYPVYHQRRLAWREQLTTTLERRVEPDFAAALLELGSFSDRYYSELERERLQANQDRAAALLIALEQSFSDKQRSHLLAELAKIIEDVERLSTPDCHQR